MENTGNSLKPDRCLAVKEKEAAALLNVSDAMLSKLRLQGTGPQYIKMPTGAIRYRVQDLVDFLESHTVSNNDKEANP